MSGEGRDEGDGAKLPAGVATSLQAAFEAERLIIAAGGRLVDFRLSGATVAVPLAGECNETERPGLLAIAGQCAARLAVMASLPEGAGCRVVEHKVDYGGAVPMGDIIAEAAVVRPGGSITVARARIFEAGGQGRTLAVMQATFLHDERKKAKS